MATLKKKNFNDLNKSLSTGPKIPAAQKTSAQRNALRLKNARDRQTRLTVDSPSRDESRGYPRSGDSSQKQSAKFTNTLVDNTYSHSGARYQPKSTRTPLANNGYTPSGKRYQPKSTRTPAVNNGYTPSGKRYQNTSENRGFPHSVVEYERNKTANKTTSGSTTTRKPVTESGSSSTSRWNSSRTSYRAGNGSSSSSTSRNDSFANEYKHAVDTYTPEKKQTKAQVAAKKAKQAEYKKQQAAKTAARKAKQAAAKKKKSGKKGK